MQEDGQHTVPQAVHRTTPEPVIHMKHDVNDVAGAEQWGSREST